MAQRSVEIRLGKLVTDEEIRQRFLKGGRSWRIAGRRSAIPNWTC